LYPSYVQKYHIGLRVLSFPKRTTELAGLNV
jgi:hypothetical protein